VEIEDATQMGSKPDSFASKGSALKYNFANRKLQKKEASDRLL
jgi:hypothetical protein